MIAGEERPPLISIIMPVYNSSPYLEKAVQSAVGQSYRPVEVVLYDDGSTDEKTRGILMKYKGRPGIKVFFSPVNEGISMATNRAIAMSTGEYLAFLDCDDILKPGALEVVAGYIKKHPDVGYFYSNREHIDERGGVTARYDLSKYSTEKPYEMIMKYMFPSHLKVIKKSAFRKVGLFKKIYDTCQDYDMALRLSEWFKFKFIPEYLYQYRIHSSRVSVRRRREQAQRAYRARDVAVVRRNIFFNHSIGERKVSVVMLTRNRLKRTAHSISRLYENTVLPFEFIIVDNNSGPETRKFLDNLAREKSNLRVLFQRENTGCAAGRRKAVGMAEGDYIVTLDNDCEVTPYWLENLITRIVEEPNIGCACAKVVLPDGKIQYNGGSYQISGGFIKLSFIDEKKMHSDLETFMERDCHWLPGGATIYKRRLFEKADICPELRGGFEDADLSLRIHETGYRLVNCPTSLVVHHHISHETDSFKEPGYYRDRYDRGRILRAVVEFYRRNRLIVYDPWLYDYLQIPHATREETVSFFSRSAQTL
ncbi:MAG: glycosyltransferase family 2 protein [Bacillota bacterium]